MQTRISLLLAAGALFALTEVRANPTGVPVDQPGPLSCSTAHFKIDAQLGANDAFPIPTQCVINEGGCSEYRYTLTKLGSKNPDHVVFAVNATQDLESAGPSAFVNALGAGDGPTGFLKFAQHEYAVRVNPTPQNPASIVIVGSSSPEISTVVVRSGNITESCLIAGPGVTGDPFQPVFITQDVMVAGGECVAHLFFDASGNVVDVTTDPPCVAGSAVNGLFIGGEEIQNNRGPHGITFGDNTTTCYGPKTPSPPRCVCTKTPCP